MAAIRAIGVGKTFPLQHGEELLAVDKFDLEVAGNEFVAIVGPSGCGKSTFRYMVSGFVDMTEGQLLHNGVPITGTRARPGNRLSACRALSLAHRAPEHRIRAPRAQHACGRARSDRSRIDHNGEAHRLRGRFPEAALGRHASAGRSRPYSGPRPRIFS